MSCPTRTNSKLIHEAKQLEAQFPGRVYNIPCDITKTEEVESLVQATMRLLKRVDWIYNNAGIIGNLAPVWDLNQEQINQVMDVNVYGMINIIRAFIPFLFEQNFNSHIVNIASLYALCSGGQLAPYSMSKHAVLALSESLYFDLKRLEKPVNVSVAFPSFTDTALLANKSSEQSSGLQDALGSLLSRSRPAIDIAKHIVQEVELKRFYILPDKEVKGYCEERSNAIVLQENPHLNNVEKLMTSLIKRRKS